MATFDMSAELDFQVQVPEKFLKEMREACIADDASEFFKKCQEMYPDNDDEFLLMILRNGFKRQIRACIVALCESSGIGGSFSPVKVRDRTPPSDVQPVLASAINEAIPK